MQGTSSRLAIEPQSQLPPFSIQHRAPHELLDPSSTLSLPRAAALLIQDSGGLAPAGFDTASNTRLNFKPRFGSRRGQQASPGQKTVKHPSRGHG